MIKFKLNQTKFSQGLLFLLYFSSLWFRKSHLFKDTLIKINFQKIISKNSFKKIASKHWYKEKWLERLAMEKSDKLDGSKGFEILYLCHPQTGQASKEEKIKAELYGALQLLLGGAAES